MTGYFYTASEVTISRHNRDVCIIIIIIIITILSLGPPVQSCWQENCWRVYNGCNGKFTHCHCVLERDRIPLFPFVTTLTSRRPWHSMFLLSLWQQDRTYVLAKTGWKSVLGGWAGVEEATFTEFCSCSWQNVSRWVSGPKSISATGCRNCGNTVWKLF